MEAVPGTLIHDFYSQKIIANTGDVNRDRRLRSRELRGIALGLPATTSTYVQFQRRRWATTAST